MEKYSRGTLISQAARLANSKLWCLVDMERQRLSYSLKRACHTVDLPRLYKTNSPSLKWTVLGCFTSEREAKVITLLVGFCVYKTAFDFRIATAKNASVASRRGAEQVEFTRMQTVRALRTQNVSKLKVTEK